MNLVNHSESQRHVCPPRELSRMVERLKTRRLRATRTHKVPNSGGFAKEPLADSLPPRERPRVAAW